MLFFLSKGYFASCNCKKEIDATLTNKNPIILLQETDPDRGGVPISQIHADCDVASQGEWLDQIFVPRRPVIPFLRVKEFKIISLKMIVASLLQHQRNGNEKISMEAKLKKADDESFKQHGSFALQRSTVQRSTGGSTPHKGAHAFLKALNEKDNAVPEAAGSSDEKMAASASRSMDNPDDPPAATPTAAAGSLYIEALDIPAAINPTAKTAGNGAALSDLRRKGSCTARLVRRTSYDARLPEPEAEGTRSSSKDGLDRPPLFFRVERRPKHARGGLVLAARQPSKAARFHRL